jgi:hypothetical protein
VRRALLLGVLLCSIPRAAHALPIGLRFSGTVDLSAFGVSAPSAFDGTVTWDSDRTCGPGGGGEGDFPLAPLDGSAPCAAATLRIDSVDQNTFDLNLSRLMLFSEGMVLQLWFVPPVDLDGFSPPDLALVELGLWQPYGGAGVVFPDIGQLPEGLSFLPRLTDRTFVLASAGCVEFAEQCVRSEADTLTVVPEPSSTALFIVGLSAVGAWRTVRRKD